MPQARCRRLPAQGPAGAAGAGGGARPGHEAGPGRQAARGGGVGPERGTVSLVRDGVGPDRLDGRSPWRGGQRVAGMAGVYGPDRGGSPRPGLDGRDPPGGSCAGDRGLAEGMRLSPPLRSRIPPPAPRWDVATHLGARGAGPGARRPHPRVHRHVHRHHRAQAGGGGLASRTRLRRELDRDGAGHRGGPRPRGPDRPHQSLLGGAHRLPAGRNPGQGLVHELRARARPAPPPRNLRADHGRDQEQSFRWSHRREVRRERTIEWSSKALNGRHGSHPRRPLHRARHHGIEGRPSSGRCKPNGWRPSGR